MKFSTYIKKSLAFYRRTHTGVVLGVAVSTAILVGALVIGDSVRYSLRQLVYDRLGQTAFALQTGDRFFRAELADELATRLGTATAPLLQTRGIAIAAGGEFRVNQIQVFGVDGRFGVIGNAESNFADFGANDLVLNQRLAKKLNANIGDEILLRIEKLDAMPQDAPLATDSDISAAIRFTLKKIATAAEFGRFNLQASQVEPYSAFVSLAMLSSALEMPGKANVMLIAERPNQPLATAEIQTALADSFALTDAGFSLKSVHNNAAVELRSERIFLDPPVVQRIKTAMPQAIPIFTYFVNELRIGDKITPYSFVTSATTIPAADIQDDEIIINRWLADDLGARAGDTMQLAYFIIGPMRTLVEDSATFRIKQIVPLTGVYADRDLMPDFPGLAEEENCRDWEAGFPIDYDKIRAKDEQYWDDFRGTPKAFVSLKTAQQLWGNRFGDVTALRFRNADREVLEKELSPLIDPVSLGFVFQPVRAQGLRAASQSVDFSQLFLGLSFFLILAALLLTGLLFVFGVEQRTQESGLLLALGFRPRLVRRFILAEGLVLAVIGSLLGLVFGLIYHEIVLFALKTIWQDIVGTAALQLKIKPLTLLSGCAAGILMSLLSMWLVARRHAKHSIAELQKDLLPSGKISVKRPVFSSIIGLVSIAAAAVIWVTTNPAKSSEASSAFFGAGSLLLAAGLAFANVFLARLSRTSRAAVLSIKSIGRRNNTRRRLRSLTLICLLASGVFITFTVGANRTSPMQNVEQRSSGTGGFALWGASALPILHDLNSQRGQDFYGFEKGDATFVQLKLKEGDDASCLNLNRVTNPPLLGLPPAEFDRRGAFSFAALAKDVDPAHPWPALDEQGDSNIIPGYANQTDITWGLGKAVGDTLFYVDERGRQFGIRLAGGLANSIFQGSVLIAEESFVEKYPSVGGWRVFLVDAPFSQTEELSKKLAWTFQDQGLDLTPTVERLTDFSKVTNTYLSIFMLLGGLGLVLGSLGIGIVLLRNVLERRGELALLRAVGFDLPALRKMVLSEHIVLLLAGIAIGAASSLFAVLPALLAPGARIPYVTIVITLLAVLGSGLLWTWLAAKLATRGELLSALRNE